MQKPITVAIVRETFGRIQAGSESKLPQHEELRKAEDELYLRVLEAVAKGHPQSKELAAEAIKVAGLNFSRRLA